MGEPGNAPASNARYPWAAVIFPSFVTPIFTLTKLPDVGPDASMTSDRVMNILTGLPVFLDRSAANGSK